MLKISNLSKKNKTPDTPARQKSTRQMTVTDDMKMVVAHDRQVRQPITAPTRNWRFSASYDSFVLAQTLVRRMNICGKNRQLLVAANLYSHQTYQHPNPLRFPHQYLPSCVTTQ
jgi:hypothetical protein